MTELCKIGQALPLLSAPRFDLRELRGSDAGLLSLYAGDERVARMTRTIPHPMPPGAVESFIRANSGPERRQSVWVLDATRLGGSELLGLVSLTPQAPGRAEIGYWVAPALWHTGLASEAVETLVAANPQGLSDIRATVFQDNPHSARVLMRAGFTYLGDGSAFSVAQNRTVPTWTYAMGLGAAPA